MSESTRPDGVVAAAERSPFPRSEHAESLHSVEPAVERTEADRLPAAVRALSDEGHGFTGADERALASAVASPYVTDSSAYDDAWERVRRAGGSLVDYVELHAALLEGVVSETLADADVDSETAAELEDSLAAAVRTTRESLKRPIVAQGRTDGAAEEPAGLQEADGDSGP